MAEPGYPPYIPPIGIGPSPPPVNGHPAHPGGNPPPPLWIPPTNNPNTLTPNNPPPHRRFRRDIPGLHDTDVDIPGVPDIEHDNTIRQSNPNNTPQPLPLNPFQPNWSIGHPLPWNAYYPTHPDIESSPFILGINRQG